MSIKDYKIKIIMFIFYLKNLNYWFIKVIVQACWVAEFCNKILKVKILIRSPYIFFIFKSILLVIVYKYNTYDCFEYVCVVNVNQCDGNYSDWFQSNMA